MTLCLQHVCRATVVYLCVHATNIVSAQIARIIESKTDYRSAVLNNCVVWLFMYLKVEISLAILPLNTVILLRSIVRRLWDVKHKVAMWIRSST